VARYAVTLINGLKTNLMLCAALVGDRREEIVAASLDGQAIGIFTTIIPNQASHADAYARPPTTA
jgi:hypothetical protein